MYRVIGLLLAVCSLPLGGCGFHLRGMGSATFPPQLSVMRVTMGGAAAYPPLLVEVRDALRTEAGVRLVNDVGAKVPALTLSGETTTSDIVAIDVTGEATDYQLNYRVSFSLSDAAGREIIPGRTIKLQREYSFNKLSVLATERESRSLLGEMRRDAVEQIIRQLAAISR